METVKPFAEEDNYVKMHKILFDEIMPKVSPNSWKVLCVIVRQTIGWQKSFDVISYSQIQEKSGIKSPATASRAVKELEKLRLINVHRGERLPDGRLEPSAYSINTDVEIVKQKSEKVKPSSKFEARFKNCRDNNNLLILDSTNSTVVSNTSTYQESSTESFEECQELQQQLHDEMREIFG